MAGFQTIIFPVDDLDKAKAVFTALLGTGPYMDEPYYVGYSAAGQEIGLDPHGHAKGMTAPVAYWHVVNIADTLDRLIAAGGEITEDSHDVGGGKKIATVRDAAGNTIGLVQPA
jgi:predicted enzyme related to lactoylglutathione lyase